MDWLDVYTFKTSHLIHHFWTYQEAVTRWLIIHRNEEFHDFCSLHYIIRFIKSKMIMCSGHTARMDMRNAYEKIPLRRTRGSLVDNIITRLWLSDY